MARVPGNRPFLATFIIALLFLLSGARTFAAAWIDAGWTFRRPVDVVWNDDRPGNEDLAMVEFYTNGKHLPKGEDLRLATDDGKLIPQKLIMLGPGDRVRMIFNLQKGVRRYFAYWGNPKPEPLSAKFTSPAIMTGCLMEMKLFVGSGPGGARDMEAIWNRCNIVIGATMIDRLHLGINPLSDDQSTISRITGNLFVPQDGEYQLVTGGDDQTALILDSKPVLYCPHPTSDIRHSVTLTLKRGPHPFVFYHINAASAGLFTLAWRRPDMAKVDTVARESFGHWSRGQAGALEERDRPIAADFSIEYLGEAFFADHYSHRYRFTATAGKTLSPPSFSWNFGDGQTATGPVVEHVYLEAGNYPVQLNAQITENKIASTIKVDVHRQWEQMLRPESDNEDLHQKILETYDVSKMPIEWLNDAVALACKTGHIDWAFAPAERLVALKTHADARESIAVINELIRLARQQRKIDPLVKLFNLAPAGSDLQPQLARAQGTTLLWWRGDFDAAVEALSRTGRNDQAVRRLRGQALILAGKADQGGKALLEIPAEEQPEKQVAISGAMARSVEFFITENDAEAGEDAWDKWQNRYPSDFLEGHSALLRVKLIELRKQPQLAAKVAEAFATAMPRSTYAPALLDQASRLLEKSDPARSKSLRELLKQRYPEDPLSQK